MVNLFANQLTRRIVAGAQKTADSRQAAKAAAAAEAAAAVAAAAAAKETQQQRQQQQMEYWSLSPVGPSVQFWGSTEALRGRDGSVAAENFPIQSVVGELN